MQSLLSKYNIAAPRYTSYPTVPYWNDMAPSTKVWRQSVQSAFDHHQEISLYIHLPFCEQLCTYCGCNKRITKNHAVELPYLEALLQEWSMYRAVLGRHPLIRELHLGGGTPTFFQPENLKRLISGILEQADLADNYEFSVEAHPNSTSFEHLETLYDVGFRRISIGVQDFSDRILKVINRKQTASEVKEVTFTARALGYESINYDIIFGLPFQTPEDTIRTMEQIKVLQPDRIAYYSYAHVPWIKPSQRAYSEADLPDGEAKRHLYELGCAMLEETGYSEIGLDHFALRTDALYQAKQKGTLHRNFMGYTPNYTRLSIGLGASSISDSWGVYIQNEKKVGAYQNRVSKGELPYYRGHVLTQEDQIVRQHILNIMCQQKTEWHLPEQQSQAVYQALEHLEEMVKDGLVNLNPFELEVTKEGQAFIRNISLAFDARYWAKQPEKELFSKVI